MVCVPCIFIPVLLFLWHKFVQPYILRFWNPWEKKDEKGVVQETQFPFSCPGGVCPYPNKKLEEKQEDSGTSDPEKSKAD